jgi:hypothetical protein
VLSRRLRWPVWPRPTPVSDDVLTRVAGSARAGGPASTPRGATAIGGLGTGVGWAQVDLDLETVHGRARAVVASIRSSGSQQRRTALDVHSRHVLRALDADVERLRDVAAACRAIAARLLVAEGPGPASDGYDVAAALAVRAERIVRATGLPPDAGPAARRAVVAEADPARPGGRSRRAWARWRRRGVLIWEVARR